MGKPAKNEMQQSIKHNLVEIFKTLTGEIIPGAATTYSIINAVADFRKKQIETRLEEFHRKLIKDEVINEIIIDQHFDPEDYYNLLNYCINDEEKDKIDFYATFYKSLLLNMIGKDNRIILLKSLKDLNIKDIFVLKDLYIDSYGCIKDIKKRIEQANHIIEIENQISERKITATDIVSVQRLSAYGLIDSTKKHLPLTKCGINLVECLFKQKEITPEWVSAKIIPHSYALVTWIKNPNQMQFDTISSVLSECGYITRNCSLQSLDRKRSANKNSMIKYMNDIFVVIIDAQASETSLSDLNIIIQENMLNKSIFIERIKSKNKSSGLWQELTQSSELIFTVSGGKEDDRKKLKEKLLTLKDQKQTRWANSQ